MSAQGRTKKRVGDKKLKAGQFTILKKDKSSPVNEPEGALRLIWETG